MKTALKILVSSMLLANMSVYATDLTEAVKTQSGSVQGAYNDDQSVKVFRGIPYAKAPVGELRWHSPQPADSWDGVKQTTQFQAACYQVQNGGVLPWTSEFLHNDAISEDCLYLNIWSPAQSSNSKKPVVVFIHGGGFVEGSGSVSIYDGENLAKEGVVFITLNYRLGEMGFLAATGLNEAKDATGNYGLEDQIAALKWIKDNVAQFGGDADNITIMGQSAGANSVLTLNLSPLTDGLFAKSVIESSSPTFYHSGLDGEALLTSRMTSLTYEQKVAKTDAYLQQKGIKVAALKTMPTEEIIKLFNRREVPVTPAIDGKVLDKTMYEILTTTQRHTGPIMLGVNKDETSGFIPSYRTDTQADFDQYIARSYPSSAQQIAELFPAKSVKELNRQENLAATHNLSKLLASYTGNKVYTYYFDQDVSWKAQAAYGTFHTAEVPFILKTLDKVDGPVTADQRKASDIFSGHLVQFAKSGNPSFGGHQWQPSDAQPDWLYSISSQPQMTQPQLSEPQLKAIARFGQ